MWSRNKANLYIRDALDDFHYDPKALPSPIAQRKIYRNKLMLTHLAGFGGGGTLPITTLSYFFDGNSDILTVPDHADWILGGGSGDFTIEFWINYHNLKGVDDGNGIIGQGTVASDHWQINYYNQSGVGRYFWCIVVVSNTEKKLTSNVTNLSEGTWYHLAWVNNGGTYSLYLDGTSIGDEADTQACGDFSGNLIIGKAPYYNQWSDAYYDEIRISDTARWTSNFVAPTVEHTSDANTQLLIHCNEAIASGTTGSGATFVDSGNTGHTVTENGNAIRSSAQYKFY